MLDFEQREARVLDRESNRLSAAEGRRVDAFGFAESAGHKRYAMRAELTETSGDERSYARLNSGDGSSVLAEVPRGTTLSSLVEMLDAAFPSVDHVLDKSPNGDALKLNVYGDDRRAVPMSDCAAAIERLAEYFDRDGELSESAEMVCALAAAELGPVTMLECLWADIMLREAIIDQCRCECEPWQRGDRMVIDIGAVRRSIISTHRTKDAAVNACEREARRTAKCT